MFVKIFRIKMTKIVANEVIRQMPDEFELDEFIEKLVIVDALKRAKQEYKQGKVLMQAEVESKISQKSNQKVYYRDY